MEKNRSMEGSSQTDQSLARRLTQATGRGSRSCCPKPVWRATAGAIRFIHGGPKKAVLMASAEFIDALAARGFPVACGAIGENLTVSGLDPHMWRAGQRYRVRQDTDY